MSTAKLREWVCRLGQEEIPTFAQTARRMAAISSDNDSSANDLAKVILQDSAMTARVLRLVNSVFYNPSANRRLDTVSYAIVVLGFEKVRNLALTVSMMESSINSDMMSHVKKEMACAYHAAIQAQSLAKKVGLQDNESIYIAALLHRLGELMFWCFPYEHRDVLQSLSDDPQAYARVEKELLGFSLKELTDSLIIEWGLSPLLHDTLTNKTSRDQKQACIRFGFSIADCVKFSWDGPDMTRHLRALCSFVNMNLDDTRQFVESTAKHAQQGLREMGLSDQSSIISQPLSDKKQNRKVIDLFNKQPLITETRSERQSRLLRQLTHLLNEELDLNHFLTTSLESINSAIESDESFIVLFKGKERELVVKQHLGDRSVTLAHAAIRLLRKPDSGLKQVLANHQPCWSEKEILLQALEDPKFVDNNLMIAPFKAMGKELGYLFTIKTSRGMLTERDFECFRHFSDHISLAFRIFIGGKK